jgi:intein-encoded DNA endonuclease-like protein
MSKKLNINTSEVISLYKEMNRTLRQIASIYGCDKSVIGRILKRNGIEIKRHKREYSYYYEQSLDAQQKDLIFGSLLGDGGVYRHHEGKNGCRFSETHSIDQIEYLQWKEVYIR